MIEHAEPEDWVTAYTCFTPTEAYILHGCLTAAHVPAAVADANLVQANALLAPALGGVRILVPESLLAQAHRVIEAFRCGALALDDDTDVGAPR